MSTASVTGVVRDSSGSVVSGAKIILTNAETTVKHEAASNNAGNYVFVSIPPGTYSLEASASGFQTSQVPRISLAVNQTSTIDVNLQIGGVQQTVTVEAAGELLQASTSEVGAVIAEKQVLDEIVMHVPVVAN
ncbi:MAG: carboxypeptidase-like regulatory domain-containing protein, partial [Bryobacteraceae bacterium]